MRASKISSSKIFNYLQLAIEHKKDITLMPRVGEDTYAYYWVKVWTSKGPKEGRLFANSETEAYIDALLKGEETLPAVEDVNTKLIISENEDWLNKQKTKSAQVAERCRQHMDIVGDYAYTYDIHYCKQCRVQYPSNKCTVEETLL